MALLSVANLVYSLGDRPLLSGINLTIEPGQHVGMVGVNGCGKSTLLKLIAGVSDAKIDSGQIQLSRGATAGYLHQDPKLDPTRTLRQEAGTAMAHLHRLHEQIEQVTHEMAAAQGDTLDALMKKYERLEHELEAAGGYAVDHQIDAILHGLGLGDDVFDVPVGGLSGGQKGRLALAKLLLSEPDVLLLDEPTNHLDIAGRQWLEEFLASYKGAVIVVSHDRWLLDRCVSKIFELEMGQLVEYPGNYQKYRELRAERRLSQARVFEKHQDKIKREQAFIDRYRAGQRARQAQGREKRLERYVDASTIERPIELDEMSVQFSARSRCGDMVVTADAISKGYENKKLFGPLSTVIKRGDRIGIIGPNGAGKTTLLSTFLGKLEPDSGTVRLGSGVDVGYYRQTHEHLPAQSTIVEYLRTCVLTGTEQEARNLAGAFLFSGQEQDKPLSGLSGGERSRTVLAGLMARGHNLLVLDEPTNHLDIPSAERLEEALLQFVEPPSGYGENKREQGTLLLITHDRMLLEQLVDQLLVFDGKGHVRHFLGKYSEYLEAEREAAMKGSAAPRADKPRQGGTNKAAASAGKAKPESQAAEKRAASGRFGKLSQEALEKEIVAVESELAEVDQALADPEVYRDSQRVRKLQRQRDDLARKLGPLEDEWARRAE